MKLMRFTSEIGNTADDPGRKSCDVGLELIQGIVYRRR